MKPSDWRNATIVDCARVMLRETPAGPRGTVIGNAPEGMVTAQHEVLVRWVGVAKPVWEVASSLEVA